MITAEEARAVVELSPRNARRFEDNFSIAPKCRDGMIWETVEKLRAAGLGPETWHEHG